MITIQHGRQRLSPQQLQLEQLFSVKRVLASRGFTVQKEGDGTDTLLGKSEWSQNEADLVFNIFHKTNHRKELLEYINDKAEKSQLSQTVINLIETNGFNKNRNCFSTTYEWYVGELLVRKFMAFSSSYGVLINDIIRNSDEEKSGDFDVLSVLGDMNLMYIECKSGKTKQPSIKNTIERGIALHCTASVIIQQDINENGLKQKLSFDHPVFGYSEKPIKLNIKNQADSTIYKWFNCYFIDASEQIGDIETKLKSVLRIIEASKSVINMSIEPSHDQYHAIGYELSEI
jgi:hypothetical protein